MDRSLVESKLVLLRQQVREQEDQLNATLGAIQILEQLLVEDEQTTPAKPFPEQLHDFVSAAVQDERVPEPVKA